MSHCSSLIAHGLLFALDLSSLPSFDWQAALIVGAVVVVGTVIVIGIAVAAPPIAIAAGATWYGTVAAVTGIAVATGAIGATAAGLYWGRQGDINRIGILEQIKRVSNQVDIFFHPSSIDPKRAADFECTLVAYEETDLASPQPTVTTRMRRVTANDSNEFYGQINDQMRKWFGTIVEGDKSGLPRRVMIYMAPYPGDGVYDRLQEMAKQESTNVKVIRTEGTWTSALPGEVSHK